MSKVDEFIFSSPIAMLRFTSDGQRLFVLTTSQTAYVLDASSWANATANNNPTDSLPSPARVTSR
jgi:hypothetical protein